MDQLFERDFFSFLSLAGVTYLICLLLTIIIHKNLQRSKKMNGDKTNRSSFIFSTVSLLIWIIGTTIVVGQFRPLKPLGDTLLGASGVLAVTMSIAAQMSISNYISGFFLAVHQPFKVGDVVYLKEKDIFGTVTDITFRHTCIRTKNGTIITVPNTVMNEAMIEDLSSSGYTRSLKFRVGNDTDLKKLEKIINEVLENNELAINSDVAIYIEAFDGQSYSVSFPLSARTLNDYSELKNTIIPELNRAFRENGITVI